MRAKRSDLIAKPIERTVCRAPTWRRSGSSLDHCADAAVAGRCVTCHMPEQSSNLIVSALEGVKEKAQMRNHWIKVYPETANR